MNVLTEEWPAYSTLDAFEDGRCAFDAGQPIDIVDKEDVYDSKTLSEAFKAGWLAQQKNSKINDF